MLSTEVRELMVKAYEKSHNATKVARNFSVSRTTVYDHVNRMREPERWLSKPINADANQY